MAGSAAGARALLSARARGRVRDRALAPPWVAIGGKSLGGRIASYVAAARPGARASPPRLPSPPGRQARRAARRPPPAIQAPALFVQGTRDALCDLERLRLVLGRLPHATLHTIEGGDHSFRLPRRLAKSDAEVWTEIVAVAARWLRTVAG